MDGATRPTPEFRTVLRGYDPAQVDDLLRRLADDAEAARRHLDELTARVRRLEAERDRLVEERGGEPVAEASYDHLGDRVAQILRLAEEEAAELREHAARAAQETRAAGHDDALREARALVEEAQQQATTILAEARRTAARLRAESEADLAAATERRDRINGQLADVRQMLAGLTGDAPPPRPADRPAAGPADGSGGPGGPVGVGGGS
jgi:DivIVA domain-containing protein